MKIVLVRHGQSEANKINKVYHDLYTGQYDSPLTSEGKLQALELKDNHIFDGVEIFVSSDLSRAKDTAESFATSKVILDKRLRERCLGDFEGKRYSELMQNPTYKEFIDTHEEGFIHSFTIRVPNGENYSDVVKRVKELLDELVTKGYKKVCLISHECTIKCIIKVANNLSNEDTLKLKIKRCEPIEVEYGN